MTDKPRSKGGDVAAALIAGSIVCGVSLPILGFWAGLATRAFSLGAGWGW